MFVLIYHNSEADFGDDPTRAVSDDINLLKKQAWLEFIKPNSDFKSEEDVVWEPNGFGMTCALDYDLIEIAPVKLLLTIDDVQEYIQPEHINLLDDPDPFAVD